MTKTLLALPLLGLLGCAQYESPPETETTQESVFECVNASDCDDGNACTADSCVRNLCVNTTISGCGGTGSGSGSGSPPPYAFSWSEAGLVLFGGGAQVPNSTLKSDHFSWVAQLAMNGCHNANLPFSCANNDCVYPGNPGGYVPTYAALESWMKSQGSLFPGVWMVAYTSTVASSDDGGAMAAAEGHCMAEVLNKLKADGAAPKFAIVDAEKGYETFKHFSNAFLTGYPLNNSSCADKTKPCKTSVGAGNGFNNRTYTPSLALTPECHTDLWYSTWTNHSFTGILPQAYWDDPSSPGLTPSYCINYLKTIPQLGGPSDTVSAGKIHVMLDAYDNWSPHSQSEYGQDIKNASSAGFSLWSVGGNSPTSFSTWKSLMETLHFAVYQ